MHRPFQYFLLLAALSTVVLTNPCISMKGDCCAECKSDYFLANCQCLQKGKYIEGLAKLSEMWFVFIFVYIPIGIALIAYFFFTFREVNTLLERAKTERVRPATIYTNKDLKEIVYKKQKTETLDIDEDDEEDASKKPASAIIKEETIPAALVDE